VKIAINKTIQIFTIASLFSIEITGDIENLFTAIKKRDTILNPNNVLSIPAYSNLTELKVNIASKEKNMNIDARGRYDITTNTYKTYLDQAYLLFEINDMFKIKLGRQRIGFGIGYLWNPVNDLDIIKDVYNLDKYTEGNDAVKFILDFTSYFSQPMSLNIEIFPSSLRIDSQNLDISYSKLGMQFYTLINDIEFGIVTSYNKNVSLDDNILIGTYFSFDIQGAILGIELSYSKKPGRIYFSSNGIFTKSEFFPQVVINLNKRISEKVFIMVEYFYNGFGYNDTEFDNMINLLNSSYSTYIPKVINILSPGYVNKNYFFNTLGWEITDDLNFSIMSIVNLDRFGAFIYPKISWTKFDNITISFEAITNCSYKENEFSLIPYNYLFLFRIQFFF
jgi:hypothetical protein